MIVFRIRCSRFAHSLARQDATGASLWMGGLEPCRARNDATDVGSSYGGRALLQQFSRTAHVRSHHLGSACLTRE